MLDNPQQKLKPGMFLTVTQPETSQQPAVLAIPEEALIETGVATQVLLAFWRGALPGGEGDDRQNIKAGRRYSPVLKRATAWSLPGSS